MRHATTAVRQWLRDYGRGTFLQWDFFVAFGIGDLALVASASKHVRDGAVPILIAEAAIGVGLCATVFAALAVFTTFYDSAFRRVLELAGGFRVALMPYNVVGAIAGACGIVGFVGALAAPALGPWVTAIAIAVSTLLCAWAIAGVISLTADVVFNAGERARLLGGADDAEQLRRDRISRAS